MLKKFMNDESGATAIEYGILAALIIVVVIAAVQTVGQNLNKTFQNIGKTLTTAK